MNQATSQLLQIPQGLDQPALVDVLNDRLRRIGRLGSGAGSATMTGSATASNGSYVTVSPSGTTVSIDLSLGTYFNLTLTASVFNVTAPTRTGGTIAAGARFVLYLDQPSAGGAPMPTFTGGLGGFASDTQARALSAYVATGSTKTGLAFLYHGSVWILDSIPFTGAAIS